MGKPIEGPGRAEEIILRLANSRRFREMHWLGKSEMLLNLARKMQAGMRPLYGHQTDYYLVVDILQLLLLLETEMFAAMPECRHLTQSGGGLDDAFLAIAEHPGRCDPTLGIQVRGTVELRRNSDPLGAMSEVIYLWASSLELAETLIRTGAYVQPLDVRQYASQFRKDVSLIIPARVFLIPEWPQTTLGWTDWPRFDRHLPEQNAVCCLHNDNNSAQTYALYRRLDPLRPMGKFDRYPMNWVGEFLKTCDSCLPHDAGVVLYGGEPWTPGGMLDEGGNRAALMRKFHSLRA